MIITAVGLGIQLGPIASARPTTDRERVSGPEQRPREAAPSVHRPTRNRLPPQGMAVTAVPAVTAVAVNRCLRVVFKATEK